MTSAKMVMTWFAAIAMALAGGVTIARVFASDTNTLAEIRSPVVVIGSSLIQYAVPMVAPAAGLFGDGRPHQKFGLSSITEGQALNLVEAAIAADAETILLEIYPFAFDFAYEGSNFLGNSPLVDSLDTVLDASDTIREGIKASITGHVPTADENLPLDDEQAIGRIKLAQMYPLTLRTPDKLAELRRLVREAKSQGTDIVFIAPPRSGAAARYIGADGLAALRAHLLDIAHELEVDLFFPSDFWGDDNFIDQAHMNRRGRELFTAALLAWGHAQN